MYSRPLCISVFIFLAFCHPLWSGKAEQDVSFQAPRAPAVAESIFPRSAAYVSPDDAHSFKTKNRKHLHCSGELNIICSPLPPGPFLGFGMPMPRTCPPCEPVTQQPAQGIPEDWGEPRLAQDFDSWAGVGIRPTGGTGVRHSPEMCGQGCEDGDVLKPGWKWQFV